MPRTATVNPQATARHLAPFDDQREPVPPPLGYIAKRSSGSSPLPVVEPQEKAAAKAARAERYFLQAAARELLPQERVAHCLRTPYTPQVNVLYAPEHKAACYGGLQTCGSVWSCAVCATKISERRRVELAVAIAAWSGTCCHATFTIRHKRRDDLAQSVEGLEAARRRLKSGRASQDFRVRFGVAGSIRAMEVTYGENGWHPHVHELLFVDAGADLAAVEANLSERWSDYCTASGLRSVNEHGVVVHRSDLSAADYLAKFGRERTWGPEHELAKQVVKSGREVSSYTPIDLLRRYALDLDKKAGRLWTHYALTFKGRRQLAWSKGLRDLLLPGTKDRTDEEVAADVEEYAVLLASLDRHQWKLVIANDCRAELLRAAETGGAAGVKELLHCLGA